MIPWYLMAKGKGGGGYKTASGPIVSVNDALAAPLRSLVANIEPVQAGSGDPSPENVRPISGWTEANMWRTGKNMVNGTDFTTYANWKSNLVSYGNVPTNSVNRGYLIPTVSGVTYTISLGMTSDSFATYVYFCSADGTSSTCLIMFSSNGFITNTYTFTAESGKFYYIRSGSMGNEASFNTQIGLVGHCQLELGSTATVYAPYTGNQYTIQLGQTIYGATLDVLTGKLTVDRAMVDLGTLTWTAVTIAATRPGYYVSLPQAKTVAGSVPFNGIAEKYKTIRFNAITTGDYLIALRDSGLLYVTGNESPTGQLCYELATPIEYTLTPQQISSLVGENNVWADTGDVTVEYESSGGSDPNLMKLAVAFMGRR